MPERRPAARHKPMSQPTPPPSDENSPGRKVRLLEDAFILLCILSLWPVVLGWQEPIYQVVLFVTLTGLVVILVRRVRRLTAARRELDD